MSKVEILGEDGRFRLSGELTFATVCGVLEQSRSTLFNPAGQPLELDLGGVSRADSAGLALLIQWMRMARQGGGSIRFSNLPAQLMTIAESSDLDDILPIAG